MGTGPPGAYCSGMNKPLSIAIFIAGVILLIYGLNAGDSIVSQTKEAVTGTPTDKSVYLVIGGVVAIVVGGWGTFLRRSH